MEVVIVDDASADDSTSFLSDASYADGAIRIVRNEDHRGLIFSRARAAELARGEYLVFLDAHCAVTPGWLESLALELEAIDGRGLVTPGICRLRPDWTIDFESGVITACTIDDPFFEFGWTSPWRIDNHVCTCTIGGGAWMCRHEWYQHIGGLDGSMVTWGLENIDVPLRTWAAGGWCLVAEQVKIGHLFNDKSTLRLDDIDYVYNKIRAVHNVFTGEIFKKLMRRLLYLSGFQEALTRIYHERETLTPFKDRFESIRQRSDAWIIDTFQLPILEAPFFHVAARRFEPDKGPTHRPSVCIIVPVKCETADIDSLLSLLLTKRTYGKYDIVLAVSDEMADRVKTVIQDSWAQHPRLRVVCDAESPRDIVECSGNSNFLAFVPADVIGINEYWIEELLLLAERRPRLLMVCPRTHVVRDGDAVEEDFFEDVWDWESPDFFRKRTDKPLATSPYHVLSTSETLVFMSRQALDYLGGFDMTAATFPFADLAIHGWLAGLETFCHPAVSVTRRQPSGSDRKQAQDPMVAYQQVLPAVKYFRSSRRERCRSMCPAAEPLLQQHRDHIEDCRREFLSGARYDDDWLFFKFNIEAP